MTPRPPRAWPRAPEDTHEWDTEENGEDRPLTELSDSQLDAIHTGLSGQMITEDSIRGIAREEVESVRAGGDIDFRIESEETPNILSLSPHIAEPYDCPVHGEVTEVISFELADQESAEYYCMRCWRDMLRNNTPGLTRERRDNN